MSAIFSGCKPTRSASVNHSSSMRVENTRSNSEYRNWKIRSTVLRLSVRYASTFQSSEGSATLAIMRFACAVIAERRRSNARSNALRATFFSAAVHLTLLLNCSRESIEVTPSLSETHLFATGPRYHNPQKLRVQRQETRRPSSHPTYGTRSKMSGNSTIRPETLRLRCVWESFDPNPQRFTVPNLHSTCPATAAGSDGRRNTCLQSIRWSLER